MKWSETAVLRLDILISNHEDDNENGQDGDDQNGDDDDQEGDDDDAEEYDREL